MDEIIVNYRVEVIENSTDLKFTILDGEFKDRVFALSDDLKIEGDTLACNLRSLDGNNVEDLKPVFNKIINHALNEAMEGL